MCATQRTCTFFLIVLGECALNWFRKIVDLALYCRLCPALASVDEVEVLLRQQEGEVAHLRRRLGAKVVFGLILFPFRFEYKVKLRGIFASRFWLKGRFHVRYLYVRV